MRFPASLFILGSSGLNQLPRGSIVRLVKIFEDAVPGRKSKDRSAA